MASHGFTCEISLISVQLFVPALFPIDWAGRIYFKRQGTPNMCNANNIGDDNI